MILQTAALLLALGVGVFVLGAALGFKEVAVIGAVIVVGVGAIVGVSGLQYRDGTETTAVTNSTTNTTVETTEFVYERTDTPTHLPLGTLVMLLGGLLTLRGLNDV
jgi:hypothetical protein